MAIYKYNCDAESIKGYSKTEKGKLRTQVLMTTAGTSKT